MDGLGALFENYVVDKDVDVNANAKEEAREKMTVDEFLSTFKGNMKRIDPSELPQNQPTRLEKLEAGGKNYEYGMSYYGSFSSIADLTSVTVKLLDPYYSPNHRQREEYEAEVSSFVAFRALEGYIEKEDVVYALQCTSSVERMMRAYEIMVDHKIQLKKIADRLSNELRDCGEECTDLW